MLVTPTKRHNPPNKNSGPGPSKEAEKNLLKSYIKSKKVKIPIEITPPHKTALYNKRLFFTLTIFTLAVFLVVFWLAQKSKSPLVIGISWGLLAFTLITWLRINLAHKREKLPKSYTSDVSKVLYLELIDTTFSIDGVLGAFAFTISVPLILIGNGLGALIVRYFTVHGVKTVKKYAYLKNGAMYSIGLLGLIMILESFGKHITSWTPPLITFAVVGFFLYLSKKELKVEKAI